MVERRSRSAKRNFEAIGFPNPVLGLGHELVSGVDAGVFYAELDPIEIGMHAHRGHVQVMIVYQSAKSDIAWISASGRRFQKRLPPSSVCVVAPGVVHSLLWRSKAGIAKIFAPASLFSEASAGRPPESEVQILPLARLAREDSVLGGLFFLFNKFCVDRASTPSRRFLLAASQELVSRVVSAAKGNDDASDQRTLFSSQQESVLTAFLDLNLHRHVPVKEMAALVHLSNAHFIRLFTHTFGQPPVRYHLLRRLKRAEGALLRNDCSILDVVSRFGFGDQSYFSRAFIRHLHYRPSDILRLRSGAKRER